MRRRNNFLIAALVAAATYATLSAFIQRPYGWHRGWRHHHYYEDRHRDRYNDGNDPRRNDDRDTEKSTDTTSIY
ncbi:MAG TPA: hypothetical protein VK628_10480 [Flavitalea sp.]|nr:hypothetical protein [Flavitalea sp.]